MTMNRRLFAMLMAASVLAASGCASSPASDSAGRVIDDTVITTKVKAAFVNDPVVKARQVSVETYNGQVQLSGWVNSAGEAQQAVSIARKVEGVKSVHNDIRIR